MKYVKLASQISLRYAIDEHEGKDIVQNAFVKVFTKIETFDAEKGTFEQWFRRIVINEAIQQYRKRQKYDYPSTDDIFDGVVAPIALDNLKAEDILALLRKLSDGYRLVFTLYVIEKYTHQEIAEILNITPSTSRSQLTRAKRLLQQMMIEQNTLEHEKKIIK
ncbi:MAG: RNA polymerase sigma factor [Bacteroidota bacterium]